MPNNIQASLRKLEEIQGFIAASLVDAQNGLLLASQGGSPSFNVEVASAANTDVVRAKRKAIEALGLNQDIEDILISLEKQYHLIRPLKSHPYIFIYVALDRKVANLAMARLTLINVEKGLSLT